MDYPSFEDVVKARENLMATSNSHWYFDDFLNLHWWILLAASILPWIIWLKYRDKARTFELLTYGMIWSIIATSFDVVGGNLILWGYPDILLPMVPPLLPADITVIPITFMFVYQIAKSVKTYILGSLLASAGFAYVLEPIFIKGEMFIMHNWNHTLSFLGFFIISLFIKWVVVKFKSSQLAST